MVSVPRTLDRPETSPRLGPASPARQRRRRSFEGYLFIAPWLLGFLLLLAGPIIASVALSFFDWDLISSPEFVGTKNYARMVDDDLVWTALGNTAYFTIIAVPVNMLVGFLTALLVNTGIYGRSVFRTIYYIPSATPVVANALLWYWILEPRFGLANGLLRWLGLPEPQWLQDPDLAKLCFVIMGLWGTGSMMVVFLAGMQTIPSSLYDAARVDGAGWWRRMTVVTLPMLSPIILFNFMTGMVASFQTFTLASIMTDGGPQNSTLFALLYIYRLGFEQFRMGYAATVSILFVGILIVFCLIIYRLVSKAVYYES